ncbi:hypothetical protein, partial [Umezawaea beigongshangensis]|uniref:hypothetical protein n=1 Tax=Umezawaea beigongshangensis TaxID=2780383 RepID=UPI0018F24E2A
RPYFHEAYNNATTTEERTQVVATYHEISKAGTDTTVDPDPFGFDNINLDDFINDPTLSNLDLNFDLDDLGQFDFSQFNFDQFFASLDTGTTDVTMNDAPFDMNDVFDFNAAAGDDIRSRGDDPEAEENATGSDDDAADSDSDSDLDDPPTTELTSQPPGTVADRSE